MVQKRPFVEESYDVSSKHQRLGYICQLEFFSESPSQDVSQEPHSSVEGGGFFAEHIAEIANKLESGKTTDPPMCTKKDIENTFPVGTSTSSRDSSSVSEEDVRSEAPIQVLFPPEQCNPFRPRRTPIHPEDTYSYLLGHPPSKQVSIGPDFQADIPDWCGNGDNNAFICSDSAEASTLSQASDKNLKSSFKDKSQFLGSCVILMPEADQASCSDDGVGSGRIDCYCEIPGSVGCVQQHIEEARENLSRSLGLQAFLELGFGDMGEAVAEKWSEEDEQLFHDVVFSNPASLDKNFWDCLEEVFPSRTNEEIVSYYFNVFMLRKRAEQNRCDPMNIDSDNDEWEGGNELEEDEDSCPNEIHEDDSCEHDEVIKNTFDYYKGADFCGFKGNTIVSGTCPKKLLNYCSFDLKSQTLEKTLAVERGDHDSQDDSCTSSDTTIIQHASQVEANDCRPWGSHDFVLEPCDTKVWDFGYLACPRNEVDFLPTCSMIEEVFGAGAWNYKSRDDKGLS